MQGWVIFLALELWCIIYYNPPNQSGGVLVNQILSTNSMGIQGLVHKANDLGIGTKTTLDFTLVATFGVNSLHLL